MISKILTVLFTVLFLSACTNAQVPINGFTLGSASFNGGKLHFVKDLNWALTRTGHPTEKLRLVGRDQWSVYLCGTTRSYEMIADYWRKLILENGVSKYQITSATVGIINGRNIGSADYNGGSFKQTALKSWTWTNSGNKVDLVETDRDEWSVYLKTKDGKMFVMIDYHCKWVRFRASGGIFYDVFQITGATHSTFGYRIGC